MTESYENGLVKVLKTVAKEMSNIRHSKICYKNDISFLSEDEIKVLDKEAIILETIYNILIPYTKEVIGEIIKENYEGTELEANEGYFAYTTPQEITDEEMREIAGFLGMKYFNTNDWTNYWTNEEDYF